MVGMILQMQNKAQEAELQFEAILERHPKAAAAADWHGCMRIMAGPDRALTLARLAREQMPEEAASRRRSGGSTTRRAFQSRQRPSSSAASKNNQAMPCSTITWAWPTQQPVSLLKLGASSSTRSSCSLSSTVPTWLAVRSGLSRVERTLFAFRLFTFYFLLSTFYFPRYTSSVTGSPCDVLLCPIVMNIIVKFSFGDAPCQWYVPPGMNALSPTPSSLIGCP